MLEPAFQTAETARLAGQPTNDLTAYDLYLRAYAMFLSSASHNPEALRAIRVTGPYSRAPRSAVIGCFLTAEAKLLRRTV
jgi:hypothetical protein